MKCAIVYLSMTDVYKRQAQCRSQRPELEEVAPGHVAACFHARELRKEVSPR